MKKYNEMVGKIVIIFQSFSCYKSSISIVGNNYNLMELLLKYNNMLWCNEEC